jgi:hypothetical protein
MSASARTGTPQEQRDNFFKMQELSAEFYRIGRYLMRERKRFADLVVDLAKVFIANPKTMETIRDPRARECTGVGMAALQAAHETITGEALPNGPTVVGWFLNHGKNNADEIEKDIFRLRWISDCVSIITGGDRDAKNFLQVRRGAVLPDGSINILQGNNAKWIRRTNASNPASAPPSRSTSGTSGRSSPANDTGSAPPKPRPVFTVSPWTSSARSHGGCSTTRPPAISGTSFRRSTSGSSKSMTWNSGPMDPSDTATKWTLRCPSEQRNTGFL